MLVVNSLINWTIDNNERITERILWFDTNQDLTYVININSNNFPYQRRFSEIEDGLKEGNITVVETDPFKRIIDEKSIPEKHRDMRDKAWRVISEISYLEPLIFIFKERRKLMLKVCKQHEVSESTVSKYLKKYWKRGKTKNALLPDFYLCGGRGKEKKAGKAKRGRPRKNTEILGSGVNVDEEIIKIFRVAINKFYYTGAKNSLTLTYELILKEFFSCDYKINTNNIKIPIILPSNKVPTFAQFRYWFEKERDLKKEIKARKSAKKYEQQHRAVIGTSTLEAMGPGSVYQIDATIGDVYLVSRFNRSWIIGRPVIYGIIDVFSRMVVGIYVGLEGPSWIGAMMALGNAATNKVEFCKGYEIDIEEDQWPVHYLPESILADRGELEGTNIESLINTFHIKIQNTPPYRADWKGIIEQHFRVTNLRVKPFLPGVVNQDARERGDRDYKLDAKLDIYQFTQIIIKCALYHNNHHYLKDYSREEMMIEDDVAPIPLKLWNWGITNRSGKLRFASEENIKLSLMPWGTATVTGKGIKFKNLYYGSNVSLKERWFEKARNKGSWKLEVSYDPRNMDYIYIKKSDGMGYEKCFLLESQYRYKDKRFEEINYLLEYEKLQFKKAKDNELQDKIELISEIENIVKQVEKDAKDEQLIVESNSKRMKKISQNRKIEKSINREQEAFELDKSETVEGSEVIPFTQVASEIDTENEFNLLIKKQKEALKKTNE